MDFGEVLTKAWKVIWKHKILWLFGFLASCGSGGGGGGGSGANFNFRVPGGGTGDMPLPQGWEQFFNQVATFFEQIPPYVYIIVALAIFLLLIIIPLLTLAVATLGRAGLVKGAWQSDEEVERLALGDLFKQSLPYFWRVFLLYLGVAVISVLIALLIIIPAVLLGFATMGIGLIVIVPLICMCVCILIPVSWAVGVLMNMSVAAIVGEDLGLVDGVKRAWAVAKSGSNPGNLIAMALILFIAGGIIRFIIGLPILIVMIPILGGVLAGALAGSGAALSAGIIIGIVLFLLYLPVALFLGSVLESYIWSAWTLTYRRIRGEGA